MEKSDAQERDSDEEYTTTYVNEKVVDDTEEENSSQINSPPVEM